MSILSISDKAPTTIAMYVSAICSQYKLKGVIVKNDYLLNRMLTGVKVLNKGERQQRLPVPIQLLPSMVKVINGICDVYQVHLYSAMVLVSFHSLLRLCEVMESKHKLQTHMAEMLTQHFTFGDDLQEKKSVVIFRFTSSKTDRISVKKEWTWIASEKNKLICPMSYYLEYLKHKTKAPVLFCLESGKPVPRQTFVKILDRVFQATMSNHAKYKSHSLCMGGAVYLRLSG